jgi:Cellulase (glycosyl hydrolase family 5)
MVRAFDGGSPWRDHAVDFFIPSTRSALEGYCVGMISRIRRTSAMVVLVLWGLASLAPAGHARAGARASASSSAPLGGVNIGGLEYDSQPAEADQQIAFARQLHAKVVRTQLPWAIMQPHGPNQLDSHALAFADRLMADAAAAGIKVIATALSTPCWASSAPAQDLKRCSATRLTSANAWPPSEPGTYATFVAYLARRYGTRLAAIEIWNEPDQANELYFAGRNKVQHYAAVLRAAYPAIKQANPSVTVIAGSLVGSNGVFLRALYAAGIKGYYDGLAVHYYSLTLASVRSIRQAQLANQDNKPLWLDEFGWSSCWPQQRIQDEQACVTTQIQRVNIANIVRSLAHTSYVAAEVLYQLRDSAAENFGLLSVSGQHKPAFSALAGALASPFARVSPVTLTLHRRGGHVVASGSGPVGDFMGLEATTSRFRYRATFVLDRFNRYSIGLPAVLGVRGLRVRAYQYWMGPGKAAHKSI